MVHFSSGGIWTLLGTVLYPCLVIWILISNLFLILTVMLLLHRLREQHHDKLKLYPHLASQKKREPASKECQKSTGKTSKRKGDNLRTHDDSDEKHLECKIYSTDVVCSDTNIVCAIIIVSHVLIQLKFYCRSRTALLRN